MKACTVFVASAVVAMVAIDSVAGYAKYLEEIPNGSMFAKTLGHKGDSGYTDFGSAFSAAGTWTADFCKAKYPGTDMTNGAAFGDPCCTWKKGGSPDKTVSAWTDKPSTATVCASAATPAVTPAAAPASPAAAPASPAAAPAATAAAPAGKPAAPAPAPAGKPAAPAPAPAGKPVVPGPAPAGKPSSKCKVKEEKSLDDEESNTDDEEIDY